MRKSVRYTSAKIVLVGESNVGKSCLAMRLAEDRYPEDHEHGTTHGMRFWPMEAEELHPAAKPPEGQRRDVVLWDFGGQDEYQLVHQMFLHDMTLALVLIDPTRGRAAMAEARDWNKRLEKHLGKDRTVKLLVGAKVDRKRDLIDQNSIDAVCEECGFAAFLDLSAKTGRNTGRLRKLISDALDWDQMAKTSRPELFQHIRDDIEARRKKKQIVLMLRAFKRAIQRSAAKLYEEAAVDAVSDQLATQGIIVRTRLTGGDEALVLQLPTLELIDHLGTDAQKCIFVPGNHDVQDLETAYRWFGAENKARGYNRDESRWHREGNVVFVEDAEYYSHRLKRFNDAFFSKVVKGEEYPLNPNEQGLSYLFDDTGIQFLTLNSAWQIDQFNRNRSGIHVSAIHHATALAEAQIKKARKDRRWKKDQSIIRLAVWHHALEGKWAMQDDTFLEHVQAAGVKLCLHGDVHESRRKLVNWWDKGGVYIVGAGTFGSPEEGRPESTPRLYNLIEIQTDLKSIRVHTRQQRKEAGAWKGWHEWANPDGNGQVPYFDIEL